MKNCDK